MESWLNRAFRQFPFLLGGIVLLLALGVVWFGSLLGESNPAIGNIWVGPVFVTVVVLFLAVLADSARL